MVIHFRDQMHHDVQLHCYIVHLKLLTWVILSYVFFFYHNLKNSTPLTFIYTAVFFVTESPSTKLFLTI